MLLIIKFLRFLVGPMIIIIGLALNSYAQDKTALQQKRTATMKILARSMGQLKNASDIADMKIPAIAIASATNKLFNMWPGGSGGGSTRAKAEIWSDKTDFKAKLMDLKKATDMLVSSVDGTDLALAKSAFIGVGRTCGTCHKLYRGPKL